MADVQCENGFTKIANQIMDALARTRIPGEARQVLDFILRKTYGFNKQIDAIALSQFVDGTGLKKPHVCNSIKFLLGMGIITKKGNAKADIFGLVKDFELWRPLPKKVMLPKKVIIVTEKGNKSLPNLGTTKDNTKDNTKKRVAGKKCSSVEIPPDLNTPYFLETWGNWKQYRKEKKKPLTVLAEKIQLKKLDEWGHDSAIDAIEAAILGGWQGLFEPKTRPGEVDKFAAIAPGADSDAQNAAWETMMYETNAEFRRVTDEHDRRILEKQKQRSRGSD